LLRSSLAFSAVVSVLMGLFITEFSVHDTHKKSEFLFSVELSLVTAA
jgi:hypothetical protein